MKKVVQMQHRTAIRLRMTECHTLIPIVLASRRDRSLLVLLLLLSSSIEYARLEPLHVGRPSHRNSPSQVRIAVAQIPEQFTKGNPETLMGFASLGRAIDIGDGFWESQWHEVDKWWINQLSISPMRVGNDSHADIIFVPATLRTTDVELMKEFLSSAQAFLPYLGKKPHVLVLDHPMDLVKMYHKELFEEQRDLLCQFILVSPEGYSTDWKICWESVVGTPYFGSVHWHRGMSRTAFSPMDVLKKKSTLVAYSGKVRHFSVRYRFMADCMDHAKDCTFIDWSAQDADGDELARSTLKAMKSSWYMLMPRGDSILRNAFFDALMFDCIPVMSEEEYARYCPYNDVIDYHAFAQVAAGPEEGSTIKHLADAFDERDIMFRLQNIHEMRHVFQYSLNPAHELIRFDRRHIIAREDDAFTFTWKAILRRICDKGMLKEACAAPGGGKN